MSYQAPIRDVLFTLEHICDLYDLQNTKAFSETSADLVRAILEEAGKFTTKELAPLNRNGDLHGATLQNGEIATAPGFREAYAKFVTGGWQGLSFAESHGGMGLPNVLGVAFMELMQAANMAFGLCPMLTMGAIEVLIQAGTKEQKDTWLPKLITGEWTASMNLTENAAGSDVGALSTSASPQADGSFLLKGQKIFITWGEHDCTENIVHLVLARTDGAPKGTKGLSLFLVPKFLADDTGAYTVRNDAFAIGLEHKLGIHGSPTCVMEYGGATGAKGWLIGEEMRGMAMMFIMMNSARLNVGAQGVGIGERAWQQAYYFAQDRKQGRAETDKAVPAAIIHHPDVRKMLVLSKAKLAAARAIVYSCGFASDMAVHGADEDDRAKARRREDLLTPLAKSYGSDTGVEIASMGVQVHGGMGYIEETGAAQHYRDARITPIYEGTNGIQAIDLVGRKLSMQSGLLFKEILDEIRQCIDICKVSDDERLREIATHLETAAIGMQGAVNWLQDPARTQQDRLSGATAFQDMCAETIGGFYLTKGALAAHNILGDPGVDRSYLQGRIDLAHIFAQAVLTQVASRMDEVSLGAKLLYALDIEGLSP